MGARRSLARPRRDGRGDAGGSGHWGGDHPANRGDAPDGHHRLPRVARAPLPGRVEPAETASQDDGEAVAAAQGDRYRHRRPTQRRHRQRCGGESAWGRPGYRRVLGPHHGRLARRGVAPRGQSRSASRGVRRPSASPARCHGHRRGRGAAPGGMGWCPRLGHGGQRARGHVGGRFGNRRGHRPFGGAGSGHRHPRHPRRSPPQDHRRLPRGSGLGAGALDWPGTPRGGVGTAYRHHSGENGERGLPERRIGDGASPRPGRGDPPGKVGDSRRHHRRLPHPHHLVTRRTTGDRRSGAGRGDGAATGASP